MALTHYPDLTVRPPRSPRVRLGGYAILPRMLDKGRALLAGKQGEYKFACPMDQHFLTFVGVEGEDIKHLLQAEKGDGEILEWINANAKQPRTMPEIIAWSNYHDSRPPSDVDSQQYFSGELAKCGPKRSDIGSWFEFLDLDDFVSFGGKA